MLKEEEEEEEEHQWSFKNLNLQPRLSTKAISLSASPWFGLSLGSSPLKSSEAKNCTQTDEGEEEERGRTEKIERTAEQGGDRHENQIIIFTWRGGTEKHFCLTFKKRKKNV